VVVAARLDVGQSCVSQPTLPKNTAVAAAVDTWPANA
jgi:hypothetical protein